MTVVNQEPTPLSYRYRNSYIHPSKHTTPEYITLDKLSRKNRLCADCRLLLPHNAKNKANSVFLSYVTTDVSMSIIRYAVFVCGSCARMHGKLGLATVLNLSESNNTEKKFGLREIENYYGFSNEKVNSVLEFYFDEARGGNHQRPHCDADQNDLENMTCRELFIRQKYQIFSFAFPIVDPFDGIDDTTKRRKRRLTSKWANILHHGSVQPAMSKHLPERLMDYFCVFGASDQLVQVPQTGTTIFFEDIQLKPMMIDSYPSKSYSDGTSLPSGPLPMFVFPDGCQPILYKKNPTLFSFVLTDEAGTRVFGTALTIYDEVLEQEQFVDVFRKSGYKDSEENLKEKLFVHKDKDDFVFLPKVLVVLSHHPFYNAMRIFLQELYRISLNGAPLPLERYIQHFISEIPLPPPGKVEISFAHTERTCVISRPPRNRLPLVDFSFRPIFSTLSIENVVTAISCLLLENKICLFSEHYSLLSSTAEALISLLFPFTWVGVYIPIMPASMIDILDAPIPFLIGLHRRFLDKDQLEHIKDVIFIDVDNDIIHLRFEDEKGVLRHRLVPLLPSKIIGKLYGALKEATGSAHLPNLPGRLTTGNNNPHECDNGMITMSMHMRDSFDTLKETFYAPISKTIEGIKVIAEAEGPSSVPNLSRLSSLEIKPTKTEKRILQHCDLAFPFDEHLVPIPYFSNDLGIMTKASVTKHDETTKSKKLINIRRKGSTAGGSREDQKNKTSSSSHYFDIFDKRYDEGEEDGFSAKKIREAFLRFFVTLFQLYDDHFIKDSSAESPKFSYTSFLKNAKHIPDKYHNIMTRIFQTQMWEAFVASKFQHNPPAGVLLFDESIIAKINRSTLKSVKASVSKNRRSTPFLDDISDEIYEWYTPPPPNNANIMNDDTQFIYSDHFPKLTDSLFVNPREPKKWVQSRPQLAGRVSIRNLRAVNHTKTVTSLSLTPSVIAPWSVNDDGGEVPEYDSYWALQILTRSSMQYQRSEAQLFSKLNQLRTQADNIVSHTRACHKKYIHALSSFQRVTKLQIKEKVQKRKESYILEKFCQDKSLLENRVILIQCEIRRYIIRKSFVAKSLSVRKIQSCWRATLVRWAFSSMIFIISRVQARFRGWRLRKHILGKQSVIVSRYREHLCVLWNQFSISLLYRSSFWKASNIQGIFAISVHEEEILQYWTELGIWSPYRQIRRKNDGVLPILSDIFEDLDKVEYKLRTESTKPLNVLNDETTISLERGMIYEQVNNLCDQRKQFYFDKFCITDKTKRKRKLVNLLWTQHKLASDSSELISELSMPNIKTRSSMRMSNHISGKSKRVFKTKQQQYTAVSNMDGEFRIKDMKRRSSLYVSQALMHALQSSEEKQYMFPLKVKQRPTCFSNIASILTLS